MTLDPKTDTVTCPRCRRLVRVAVTKNGVCFSGPMAKTCPARARQAEIERRRQRAKAAEQELAQ